MICELLIADLHIFISHFILATLSLCGVIIPMGGVFLYLSNMYSGVHAGLSSP